MENTETSDQSVVLQANGITIEMDVIAKDAVIELNNNESTEMVEKTVKIPDENSMEKNPEPADEQKIVELCEQSSITADSGKDNSVSDDKQRGGDSEVEQLAPLTEEKFDSCSSSSAASMTDEISPSSESSEILGNTENVQNVDQSNDSVEETSNDTVTSATSDSDGRTNAKYNDAEQMANKSELPKTDAATESPSKKKSSPKKRKNRSRTQQKSVDYSQLMNYTLSVTPRQRRYFLTMPRGGRSVPVPNDDCEIFCTNIPINVLEQELIPLFEKFGKIFELRLMMSMRNPKRNAGFAFVRYTTDPSAKEATEKLNNYEILPGKLLSVRLSQPNLSLFVGNIHRGLTREQIHEKIGGKTKGLVNTFVKSSLYEETKNCGFCFLEYDCHSSALDAKRLLNRGHVWGRQLFVDWAQRRKQINENELQESNTLFVNNLPKETTEQQIIDTLSPYGTIEKVTKIKDYAFILFTDHQAVMDAMNGADTSKFGSDSVEISLALPKAMKHRNRFPSFSHRRSRYNSYNRYRSTFGSSNKLFMHKQQPKKMSSNNNTNTDEAIAGTSADQTVIPTMVITPPEAIVVS